MSKTTRLQKDNFVLAVMSTPGVGSFQPVQIQKTFFLIDKNIGDGLGGAYFNFIPYDYGPFDRELYDVLGRLADKGYINIEHVSGGGRRLYSLTTAGKTRGRRLLSSLPEKYSKYISRLTNWVQSLSFVQLVSAIYQSYPEMKVNSVFENI